MFMWTGFIHKVYDEDVNITRDIAASRPYLNETQEERHRDTKLVIQKEHFKVQYASTTVTDQKLLSFKSILISIVVRHGARAERGRHFVSLPK